MSSFYFREESELVFQCAMKVQRKLGNCLTKTIYMDALEFEFQQAGLRVRRDIDLAIFYEDDDGGRFRLAHSYPADFIVEDKILVIVKAEGNTMDSNDYLLQSLLHAANLHLALLMQFKDKKLRTKRVCRYTRYANTLNVKQEAAESFEAGEYEDEGSAQDYALKERVGV